MAGDEEPEILTPQEAADLLRVSLLTVQRQAKAGRLPGRRVGKEWRFSRSVLLEWIGSGPIATTSSSTTAQSATKAPTRRV